jgi:F0F1-type ATP synthase assembly protein I
MRPTTKHWLFIGLLVLSLLAMAAIILRDMNKARHTPRPKAPAAQAPQPEAPPLPSGAAPER